MAVRLTITNPADPGAELTRSFVQDRIVIGRARQCDVCLPDMTVSTRHAEIEVRGSDYVVTDQHSLNGTRVGDKRLVPLQPRVLGNDDLIEIAGFKLRFRLGVSPGPAEPRDETMRQAREMLAKVLASSGFRPGHKALRVLQGPVKTRRFDLPEPPTTLVIGRGAEAVIRLEDRDVSRRHAELVLEPSGAIRIRDLNSHNGLIRDGERVAELILKPGEAFTVGCTSLALEHPAEVPLRAILDAPEEETSSFTPAGDEPENDDEAGAPAGPSDADPSASADESTADHEAPPIGPNDPLAYPGQPDYVPTEREIPRPSEERGSDIGLILVGAIIVVAAVIALILLFS
jgi:pSer/pThr/pTyr-binding forkhead associated (FHA) protein